MNGLMSILEDLCWGVLLPLLFTIVELIANALALPDEPALPDKPVLPPAQPTPDEPASGRDWLGPVRERLPEFSDAGITLCISALGADLGAAAATRTLGEAMALAIVMAHMASLFLAVFVERVWQSKARLEKREGKEEAAKRTTRRRVIIVDSIGLIALFTAFARVSRVGGPALLTLIAALLVLAIVILGWRKRSKRSQPATP
jgi:hypothetical protein